MREKATCVASNVIPFPTTSRGNTDDPPHGDETIPIRAEDWDDGRVVPRDITDNTTDIEEALIQTRRLRQVIAKAAYGTRPHAVATIKLNWWTKELRSLVLEEHPNVVSFSGDTA